MFLSIYNKAKEINNFINKKRWRKIVAIIILFFLTFPIWSLVAAFILTAAWQISDYTTDSNNINVFLLTVLTVFDLLLTVGSPFIAFYLLTQMRRFFYFPFVAAFFGVTYTLYPTETVTSFQQQSNLEFGWPLNFIFQDQGRYSPPYPWEMGFDPHPDLLFNTDIIWRNFFINYLMFLAPVLLLTLTTYFIFNFFKSEK